MTDSHEIPGLLVVVTSFEFHFVGFPTYNFIVSFAPLLFLAQKIGTTFYPLKIPHA